MTKKWGLAAAMSLSLPGFLMGLAPLENAYASTPPAGAAALSTSSTPTVNPLNYACTTNAPSCNGVGTTHDFYNGTNVEALYTQNYFCDKTVTASSQNGCEAGASYKQLPPGVASAAATDPLYIPVPLGFTPTQQLQCSSTSTCIDHPMHVDLSRIAGALPGNPKPSAVANAILPGHDHIITALNSNQPEWWPVTVIGVTNQAAWTAITTAKSYAEVQTLQAVKNSGVTGNIPTNVFLYFQTLPGQLPQARASVTSTAVPPSSITSRNTTYTNLKNPCTTNPSSSCESIGVTHDWINGRNVNALYTTNYFCDTAVSSQAPSGCEAGASYKNLPPGVSSAAFTDPLYIPVPLFKGAGYLQCPAGQVCIDHPSTIDLSRLASALGASPSALANTMLPGHDHILTTRNGNQPEWWPVVVVGVTNPASFAKIENAKSLGEVRVLQAQSGSGVTGDIPTNAFLNFQTLPGNGPVTPPGYDIATSKGNVYNYGGFGWFGSIAAKGLNTAPVVGFERTVTAMGYYLVTSEGNVYNYGDAPWLGSPAASGKTLNDVTGFRMNANGSGYYVVTAKGNVFNYGAAQFHGSPAASHISTPPLVGVEVTATGGYYLLSSAGNVYNYGAANWFGSMGGSHLGTNFVSMKTTADGQGYWLVTARGNVYNFGDARWFGSPAASGVTNTSFSSIHISSDGSGYAVMSSNGHIYNFGDAGWYGSPSASNIHVAPLVGIG